SHPQDPMWHVLRLEALDAAGMEPWIQAEYPERVAGAHGVGRAIWEARSGRVLGAPDDLPAEQARLALQRGDDAAFQAALAMVPKGLERASLRTMGLALRGDLVEVSAR